MTDASNGRRTRLVAAFPDTIDALLVTRLVNVRYLTGFSGSNGAVLLGRERDAVLAVDGRYTVQAAAEAPDLECLESRGAASALVRRAQEEGVRRLGIEAGHVTLANCSVLREVAGEDVRLVEVGPLVEALRAVKDDIEIDLLRTACAVTDAAWAEVRDSLHAGTTERDVAWRLEAAIRGNGGDGPAFDSIVGFGPHSAIPHHQPTDRQLEAGDFVKVDFGARYRGYHADMTRTVALGKPADWQRDLHADVSRIQAASRHACRPGAVPADLDALARAAIEEAGHAVAHGLGHGVGLEIHEDPFLTPGSTAGSLTAAMTVTIEPGIYLAGRGGVRIEDTMLVTEDGSTALTASPRELHEVG